jgi:hypothetical protein
LDKPHILALAAETGFLIFKEQVSLKFKREISAGQCERKTFQLISLSTPVSFRWTVPLSRYILYCKKELSDPHSSKMDFSSVWKRFQPWFLSWIILSRSKIFFLRQQLVSKEKLDLANVQLIPGFLNIVWCA